MKDDEIIKALECCLKGCNAEGCEDCPLYEKVEDCEIEIPIIALDLINRQKAEIENLREENEIYRRANFLIAGQRDERDKDIVRLESELETAKSEAIREFAERLKNLIYPQLGISTYEKGEAFHFCLDEIDSLVKEMTEEKL